MTITIGKCAICHAIHSQNQLNAMWFDSHKLRGRFLENPAVAHKIDLQVKFFIVFIPSAFHIHGRTPRLGTSGGNF